MSKYYNKLLDMQDEDVLELLYDCIEILAPVSLKQYAKMEGVTKPVIIQRIKQGKLKAFKFESRQYPMINYKKT